MLRLPGTDGISAAMVDTSPVSPCTSVLVFMGGTGKHASVNLQPEVVFVARRLRWIAQKTSRRMCAIGFSRGAKMVLQLAQQAEETMNFLIAWAPYPTNRDWGVQTCEAKSALAVKFPPFQRGARP